MLPLGFGAPVVIAVFAADSALLLAVIAQAASKVLTTLSLVL